MLVWVNSKVWSRFVYHKTHAKAPGIESGAQRSDSQHPTPRPMARPLAYDEELCSSNVNRLLKRNIAL